jgi:hypothetical protein
VGTSEGPTVGISSHITVGVFVGSATISSKSPVDIEVVPAVLTAVGEAVGIAVG